MKMFRRIITAACRASDPHICGLHFIFWLDTSQVQTESTPLTDFQIL